MSTKLKAIMLLVVAISMAIPLCIAEPTWPDRDKGTNFGQDHQMDFKKDSNGGPDKEFGRDHKADFKKDPKCDPKKDPQCDPKKYPQWDHKDQGDHKDHNWDQWNHWGYAPWWYRYNYGWRLPWLQPWWWGPHDHIWRLK
jgi:hypothetical protein